MSGQKTISYEQSVVNQLSAKIGQMSIEIAMLRTENQIANNALALKSQELEELKKEKDKGKEK